MNSVTLLALLVVVLAQLLITVSANDPLLAEAHGLGADLKEHIASLAKEEKLLEHMDILTTTASPTFEPTASPTLEPSASPTEVPSYSPTAAPVTTMPTAAPVTIMPTFAPTNAPTVVPTTVPTNAPNFVSNAPTAAPTRSPTVAPTTAPTFGSTPVITFSSAIGMSGLTSPTLDSGAKTSVSEAACTTMGLSVSACAFWGSISTQTSRRALRESALSTYSVVAYVNTTVSLPTGTSADTYYTSLTTSLSDTTAFTTNLLAAATTNGASGTLGSASVTGVTSSPVEVTNPPDSSSDKKRKLSGGAIAGIVIGVIVVFSLICLAIYFFCFREASGYQTAGDSNFNARHHRNSKELPITL